MLVICDKERAALKLWEQVYLLNCELMHTVDLHVETLMGTFHYDATHHQ